MTSAKRIWVLSAWIFISFVNCATSASKPTAFMSSKGVEYSRRELNQRIYAFYQYFYHRTEIAADEILEKSEDPDVRINAILWKINASSFMQSLVFQPDPLVAYLHSWLYCALLTDYFQEGPGRQSFKEWQDIAVTASVKAEEDIASSIEKILPPAEFKTYEKRVYAMADAHPIRSFHLLPDISYSELEQLLYAGEPARGFAIATEINEMLHDVTVSAPIFVEAGLKHARWMGDLALEKMPELIAAERKAAMEDVHQETTFILETLDDTITRQRGEVFKAITDERMAILKAISTERRLILDAVREERTAVLDIAHQERMGVEKTIHDERIAILAQFDALAVKMLEQAEARSLRVIDRVFVRIIQICAIPFVLVLLLLVLGFRSIQKTLARSQQT